MRTFMWRSAVGLSLAGATLACASDSPLVSDRVTAQVTVLPSTGSVVVDGTLQLSATPLDAEGAPMTGRSVAWSSGATHVATVSSAGVVRGVAPGPVTITARVDGVEGRTVLAVVAPPAPGAVLDPTRLPVAAGQAPVGSGFARAVAAGQTYQDPNTQVTVLKLTDAATPVANGGMYHGYSEGGPNISLPWTGADGEVYYTVKVGGWLADVRYRTLTPGNWRRHPGDGEIGLAFSLNPATPRVAYVVTDWSAKRVERYNTATNRVENQGPFPWVPAAEGQYLNWLQVNLNDQWLVGMYNSNHTLVALRLSDGAERSVTSAAAGVATDEPHLDREFPVVYITGDVDPDHRTWHLTDGRLTSPPDPENINEDSHSAPLRGKIVAVSWRADAIVATTHTGAVSRVVTPSPTDWSGDYHLAGQWVQDNPDEYFALDQWLRDGAGFRLRRGFIGLASARTGDVRLLVHSDVAGGSYGQGGQGHPSFAPDGRLLLWTSNMNNSGRFDTFLARLPTR